MWTVQAYDLVAQVFHAYDFRTRAEAEAKRQELAETTWAHNINMQYMS